MSRVDVLVLNYDGRRFLGPCLAALRAQTYRDFTTVLVDNASTDDSAAFVRECFPEVRIVRLPENLGFCGGNNRGIERTGGELVALLNNDTEVAPGWLGALVAELDRRPDVGFCASRMVRLSDRATIDTAGDLFHTVGVAGKRGAGEPAGRYAESADVFGACAGAALYRRAMLEKVGLLDEDLWAMNEDVDLSFRAQLHGYRCRYVADAVVYHHVGGSFAGISATAMRLVRRNMLEVLLKNMPAGLLLRHAPAIAAYYLAGDLRAALAGHAGSVLRARWENVRRLPRTLRKRRAIQRARVLGPAEVARLLTPGRPR